MRVLVPIDDTPLSEQALPLAVDLAGVDGEMVLVSVGELPETSNLEHDAREHLGRRLEDVASRISGPRVRQRIELAGDPVRGILEVASEEDVDRIVLASHDRSAFRALIDGSIADEVREEAERTPVTVVRTTDAQSPD